MLLKIPIDRESSPESICFFKNGRKVKEIQAKLADQKMDCWEYFLIPGKCVNLEVIEKEGRRGKAGIQFLEEAELMEVGWEKERPQFHLTPECGKLERICSLDREEGRWKMVLEHSMIQEDNGPVYRECTSRDLIHWEIRSGFLDDEELRDGNVTVFRQLSGFDNWKGKVSCVCWFARSGRFYEAAFSKEIRGKNFHNLMSLPFERKEGRLIPLGETRHLRMWKREWNDISLREPFAEELRFRIAPGQWPDIRILKPDYTRDDIDGELFEAELSIRAGEAGEIRICLCGRFICYNAALQSLTCGGSSIPAVLEKGLLHLHIWADRGVMEILTDGQVLMEVWEEEAVGEEKAKQGIAENIDFSVGKPEKHFLRIQDDSGTARAERVVVYGLRGIYPDRDFWKQIRRDQTGRKCYESKSFTVYEDRVEDAVYGEPPAYIVDDRMIVSPPRVVEEFQWRDTRWGDMSRQFCRTAAYRIQAPDGRFPKLDTGILALDMAYKIALDVFYLCGSREYALPGQEDMWTAGLFQGKGEGFGVWMRDSTHTAIRGGNLIDREMAHRTLRFAAGQGFDNGADGPAMAAVGIWDYYIATRDASLVFETWPLLNKKIEEAENRYRPQERLVYAPQSTSNDAFEEPEAGGYCLGTEIYYMEAFLCMERMGKLVGEDEERVRHWGKIGRRIRKKIQEAYWNPQAGYFTSGPKGTLAYEEACWETSGIEGAIWSRFQIAQPAQRAMVLERLEQTAMTEFGIDLFPHRREKNHFCHASWGVWNAGIAAAANENDSGDLVWKLLMQQTRNAVMHKTFYEVVDVETGEAWRWPGQLWHAAGFISCIYFGLLGIQYDGKGMTVRPVPQKHVERIHLGGLRFGRGVYDIDASCAGTCLYLDGEPVKRVNPGLSGHHRLEYR